MRTKILVLLLVSLFEEHQFGISSNGQVVPSMMFGKSGDIHMPRAGPRISRDLPVDISNRIGIGDKDKANIGIGKCNMRLDWTSTPYSCTPHLLASIMICEVDFSKWYQYEGKHTYTCNMKTGIWKPGPVVLQDSSIDPRWNNADEDNNSPDMRESVSRAMKYPGYKEIINRLFYNKGRPVSRKSKNIKRSPMHMFEFLGDDHTFPAISPPPLKMYTAPPPNAVTTTTVDASTTTLKTTTEQIFTTTEMEERPRIYIEILGFDFDNKLI